MKQIDQNLEMLIGQHYEINKLIKEKTDELVNLQKRSQEIHNELFNKVDATKNKKIQLGDNLLQIDTIIEVTPEKITYKYKEILNKLLDVYDIEKRFLSNTFNKFKTISKRSRTRIQTLIIAKIK